MKKYLIAIMLPFLSSCISDVLADQPNNISGALQYARVGSPVWGREHTAPTTAVIAGVVGESGTVTAVAESHLFEWGTLVVISCVTNAATFCWAMDTDEQTMTTAGAITDTDANAGNGADGTGSCFRVEAGTYRDVTVWKDNFRAIGKVGRRSGYCTVNTTTAEWPCDSNADCSTSGVCVSSISYGINPFDRIRGVFLLSRAGTAATCFISEEK